MEAMVTPEFVERYELELKRNPRSRVFAALTEAYRKQGRLEDAKRIGRLGTTNHPDFAGGHVAYAKVLIDLTQPAEALTHLEKATRLSPDNLMAFSLLAETLLQLRRPKDALKAFKMVLFLNPEDTKALSAVRKWEFLTADEYSEDVFSMKPLFEEPKKLSRKDEGRELERAVSLADAYTIRNDLDAALDVLNGAVRLLGPLPEIEKRRRLLEKRLGTIDRAEEARPSGGALRKQQILQSLLHRINERRD